MEGTGEIRIRRALPSDIRIATDLLTEAFFQNHTNMFTYPWEWAFTFLSLEGDFPQPPHGPRLPHDILIAEYVVVVDVVDMVAAAAAAESSTSSSASNNHPNDDTSSQRRNTTPQGVVAVQAVGMVQLDGRKGRIPWKGQPFRHPQLESQESSLSSIGPQLPPPSSSSSSELLEETSFERPVYLCNLAVRESWRRKGIATKLIQAAEQLVHQEEPSYQQATHLCLKVRRNTPEVIAMYQKLGYSIFQPPPPAPTFGSMGRRRRFQPEEYKRERDDSIWWMAKSLIAGEAKDMDITTNTTASAATEVLLAKQDSSKL